MKQIVALGLIFLCGCIGTDVIDDEMDEMIIIENIIDTLKVGDQHQFKARYLNNVGIETPANFNWSSSDDAVISIEDNGMATAHQTGSVTLTVDAEGISESIEVAAGNKTSEAANERTANLVTVSSYPLSGTATLKKGDNGLILQFSDNFNTTSALPGLYVYLTNNVNTLNGALEVGKVTAFNGSQSYVITATSDLFEYNFVLFYCKPFVVPVGNGKLNP